MPELLEGEPVERLEPRCPLRELMIYFIRAVGGREPLIDGRDFAACQGEWCALAVEGRCGLVHPNA